MICFEKLKETSQATQNGSEVFITGARDFNLDAEGKLKIINCPKYIKPFENAIFVNCKVGTILINEKLVTKDTVFLMNRKDGHVIRVNDSNERLKEISLNCYKETLQKDRKIKLPTEVIKHLDIKVPEKGTTSLIGVAYGDFLKIYNPITAGEDYEELCKASTLH